MSSGETCKAIRIPDGRLVRLESDLDLDVLAKIAKLADMNLLFMLASPELGCGVHLKPLYRAACEAVGAEVPAKINAKLVYDSFETVADDLPEEYVDGLPKEDASSTT